ncbi:adenylate kinase isoenzyme 5 [Lates japonicus]|uniref:Adenylate kinase isoenzyme 5 n=1 Tax=Lates japonicus TaxID=270547 RepID=A0AAD3MAI6_LATJO|nr:adenylate kinase isoenzyme 5 [Lates japonicus]
MVMRTFVFEGGQRAATLRCWSRILMNMKHVLSFITGLKAGNDKSPLPAEAARGFMANELQSHSDRGRQFVDVLERGEQLPEDTLLELLCDAVASSVRQGKGLVISNFPTDLRQAEEYEAKMGEPSAVLLLNCSPDTMSSRVQCRGRSSSSSSFHPGTDRDGAVHRRAESFCNNSQAVAAHYERKRLLHTIDAERSPEEVFAQICQAMESCSTF